MKRKASLALPAPAKVNLFLRVSAKRPDGFHELETLFERLALADRLEFRAAPSSLRLECPGSELPADAGNLVWRAAALLKERHGVERGAAIRLWKRIPVAAGLGGGSSDAAAALVGLDRLWGLGLPEKKLLGYAAELGSDVAFFVLGARFALGRGRGERLARLATRRTLWHVLAFPDLQVLTREVYGGLTPDLLDPDPAPGRKFLASFRRSGPRSFGPLLFNTLEGVILGRYPELGRLKSDFLGAGADGALVSGSGPTVFALVRDRRVARIVAERMQQRHPDVRFLVTHTA